MNSVCIEDIDGYSFNFVNDLGTGSLELMAGGTDPSNLNFSGGGKRKRKKSRKLKKSNKSRLVSRSKKSKSRSNKKVYKRKSLSKKMFRKKSKKSRKSLK